MDQLEAFPKPLGLSRNGLARAVHVPPRRTDEFVPGKRAVTADTDLRLARYFGLPEGFFLGLQADHDLMARRHRAERRLTHGERVSSPRSSRHDAGGGSRQAAA